MNIKPPTNKDEIMLCPKDKILMEFVMSENAADKRRWKCGECGKEKDGDKTRKTDS